MIYLYRKPAQVNFPITASLPIGALFPRHRHALASNTVKRSLAGSIGPFSRKCLSFLVIIKKKKSDRAIFGQWFPLQLENPNSTQPMLLQVIYRSYMPSFIFVRLQTSEIRRGD